MKNYIIYNSYEVNVQSENVYVCVYVRKKAINQSLMNNKAIRTS